MIKAKYKSKFEHTKYTPYLTIIAKLFHEIFRENQPRVKAEQ